jgi:hypothetical protein
MGEDLEGGGGADRRQALGAEVCEIFWHVDVGGQPGVAHDIARETEPGGFGPVALERARSVGETVPSTCRHDCDIRAVRPQIGDERDTIGLAERVEPAGMRQIAVSDDDKSHAFAGEHRYAGLDGAGKAKPRCPDDAGSVRTGPLCDFVVVAHDVTWERAGCGQDTCRQSSRELGALRCVQHRSQPEFC